MSRLSVVAFFSLAVGACAGTGGMQIPVEPSGAVYEEQDLYERQPLKDRFIPTFGVDVMCSITGHPGRVLLAYSVGANGRAERISIVESGGPAMDACGYKFVDKLRLKPPVDWASSGGPARRYRFGLIYEVVGQPAVSRYEGKVSMAVITAQRVTR